MIKLNYNIPIRIIESLSGETGKLDDFLIEGIAINSTITDNKHKFLSEELSSAASTLNNVPLLKDHNNSVDSIVGRVIRAEFNENGQNVVFKARINNSDSGLKVRELIKNGDLNTVSVGANVQSLDQDKDIFIPRGIIFKELSLVAVPADGDATFTYKGGDFSLALKEAYSQVQNSQSFNNELKLLEENKNEKEKEMTENEKTVQEESKTEKVESSNFEERLNLQNKKLEAQSEVLSQILSSLSELKSMKTVEVKDEEPEKVKCPECGKMIPKEEMKTHMETHDKEKKESVNVDISEEEEVEETGLNEKNKTKIVQNYRSFTVERKYR